MQAVLKTDLQLVDQNGHYTRKLMAGQVLTAWSLHRKGSFSRNALKKLVAGYILEGSTTMVHSSQTPALPIIGGAMFMTDDGIISINSEHYDRLDENGKIEEVVDLIFIATFCNEELDESGDPYPSQIQIGSQGRDIVFLMEQDKTESDDSVVDYVHISFERYEDLAHALNTAYSAAHAYAKGRTRSQHKIKRLTGE